MGLNSRIKSLQNEPEFIIEQYRSCAKGSLFITRPSLMSYVADSDEMRQCMKDVFARLEAGEVKVEINQRYALADIQQAHSGLEARKTTGSTIILP